MEGLVFNGIPLTKLIETYNEFERRKAYRREYARKQFQNDPEYWRKKARDYHRKKHGVIVSEEGEEPVYRGRGRPAGTVKTSPPPPKIE